MELCLARAAKTTEALTNSENASRDAEKAVKNDVELPPAWRAKLDGFETERQLETQVLGNSRAECRTELSTNGYGNQFEAGVWLPGWVSNLRPIG